MKALVAIGFVAAIALAIALPWRATVIGLCLIVIVSELARRRWKSAFVDGMTTSRAFVLRLAQVVTEKAELVVEESDEDLHVYRLEIMIVPRPAAQHRTWQPAEISLKAPNGKGTEIRDCKVGPVGAVHAGVTDVKGTQRLHLVAAVPAKVEAVSVWYLSEELGGITLNP